MNDTCLVCGSAIWSDESVSRGYGGECAAAIKKAKMMVLFNDNDKSLTYNWLIKVDIVKSTFIEEFKNTKFRKEFKKKFYESMKTATRISKKQMDIMETQLSYTDKWFEIRSKVDDMKREWLNCELSNIKVTREMIEIARKLIRDGQ